MAQRRAARRRLPRLLQSLLFQRRRSLRFDADAVTLPGRALVTGGNLGIGGAVSARLAEYGVEVIVAARSASGEGSVRLDLADLDQVAAAADELTAAGPFDLVVLNAGVAPDGIRHSAQGHELAFAVNVLGHHVLVARLLAAGALAPGARVAVVTGDILVLAGNCSPDYRSTHRRAGVQAYARSKLGDLWMARELARRHPELHVVAVHPGVVRSGLGATSADGRWTGRLSIDPELSAEAVLAAALDPTVPSGAYVHNTLGLVTPRPGEPAADDARAAAFVDQLDILAASWL
jgi:NAD(P)-dependent dehydrogenase (short-subunit alcohol dehydrogenase family)